MGITIPQVVTEDRASGAQVIDGSLKFDGSNKTRITKTFSSAGNRQAWTWSCWTKRDVLTRSDRQVIFGGYGATSNTDWLEIGWDNGADNVYFTTSGITADGTSQLRDPQGWYHFFSTYDGSTLKIYVNNRLDLSYSFTGDLGINVNGAHYIGQTPINTVDRYLYAKLSQCYFIDGFALGPESFGFTDPLTNTWRPKKYTGNFNYVSPSGQVDYESGFDGQSLQHVNSSWLPFLGNTSNSGYSQNQNTTLTYTAPGSGIPYSSTIRLFVKTGSGGANNLTIDGNSFSPSTGSGNNTGAWNDISSYVTGGVLNTIVSTRGGGGRNSYWSAIEVDGVILTHIQPGVNGFYLPMDGNSPIGHDKSNPNPINNATQWSQYLTNSSGGFQSSYPAIKAFNGTVSGAETARSATAQITTTFTPPGGISYSSSVEVWTWYAGNVSLNGGSNVAVSNDQDWRTIVSGSGTLDNIRFIANSGNNIYLAGIRVDGVILIDGMYGNGWTPSGFGGSVALDNPIVSGARPILNTLPGGTTATPGVFGSASKIYYTLTSGTNSGGKYVFQNEGTQPVLNLIRGVTYEFDYSVASAHPLRFATAADAAGSTEYTDGTNTATSNVFKITVPHNAPDTLYYYCTNHGGMGNSISVTTDETKADPYAWKCVLALPFSRDISDISNEINVNSTAKAATNYGSSDSSAISNFYGNSRQFDGSNDNINYAANADLGFDGDFTIECFCTPGTTGNDSNAIIASKAYYNANYNWYLKFNDQSGGKITWYSYNGQGGGENLNVTNLGTTDANRIHHIAVTRESNVMRLYLDGVKVGNATFSRNYNDGATNGLTLARQPSGNSANSAYGWYDGHMSDFRIYKGVAKYTSDFVVPTTNPDILPDTPSGVSGGFKLAKITEGAVAFDGIDDYLSFADHNDWDIGTGAFTVECFVNINDHSVDYTGIFGMHTGSVQFQFRINAQGRIQFLQDFGGTRGNTDDGSTSGTNLRDNSWHHVALTRQSDHSWQLYVDGRVNYSGTGMTGNITNINEVAIGRRADSNSQYLEGFISNFRFINGTALYTTDFTPPTEPLTAVTNTKLLCCQSNTFAGKVAVSPNVSGINDGTIWSSSFASSTGFRSSEPATNAFDGNTSTVCSTVDQGTITFTSPVTFSSSSSIRVWVNGSTHNVSVNGGSNQSISDGSWQTVNFTNSSNSTFTLVIQRQSNADTGIRGIEIGGVVLVDPATANGNPTATNFNPFITDINAVRGQESGYPTLNPLDTSTIIPFNGNLSIDQSSGGWHSLLGTQYARSGKWYAEMIIDRLGWIMFGVDQTSLPTRSTHLGGSGTKGAALVYNTASRGDITYNGTNSAYTGGDATAATGDIISIALDLDNNNIKFYKNNALQYNLTGILESGADYTFGVSPYANVAVTVNFGQKPFKFPPPDGFQPLNAANARPETVIARPDQFVKTVLWTGNGGTQSINVGLKPDFVWFKQRTANGTYHQLYDSVRGPAKVIFSNDNIEEYDRANGLTGFDNDGFSIGDHSQTNSSGQSYVGWSWKAGGNKNTFNIDDVGYANASDVGMSAGGQNSNAYDQTRTWSNSVAADGGSTFASNQGPTKMFNGVAGMGVEKTELTTNGSATFTSPVQLSGNLRMFIACGSRGSSATGTFDLKLDGVSVFNNSTFPNNAGAWVDFGTKTWTTLQFGSASGGNWLGISAIEVAGKRLVDNGVSVANVPSMDNTGASVGTKQGFSIIKYNHNQNSSQTLSHGLTQTPQFIMDKRLKSGTTTNWDVYHASAPNPETGRLLLNSTGAYSNEDGPWNDTAPTSSVFTVGPNSWKGDGDHIVYLWHDVPGLQKFGKFSANSSTDGNFIELGFRPTLVIARQITGSGGNWFILDSKRNTFNPLNNILDANLADDERQAIIYDFLSTGFKLRISLSGDFIYAAWAEAPTFNLYGAQSNAR